MGGRNVYEGFGTRMVEAKCNKMADLGGSTGNVQDYLANGDRLAEIPPSQLIRLGIKPQLRSKMTHYEDLRDQPTAWRKKLVQMDVAQAYSEGSKN